MIARSINAELTLMKEKFTSPPMPCIIIGIAKIMLTQYTNAESVDEIESETSFPTTISLLLMGARSMLESVPLSFSPAMDSGATPEHPLKINVMISMGSMPDIIFPRKPSGFRV